MKIVRALLICIVCLWYVSDTKYNYVVKTPTPKGLVSTSFQNNVIMLGERKHILPKTVDVSSMCVSQRNGYLVFKFSKLHKIYMSAY